VKQAVAVARAVFASTYATRGRSAPRPCPPHAGQARCVCPSVWEASQRGSANVGTDSSPTISTIASRDRGPAHCARRLAHAPPPPPPPPPFAVAAAAVSHRAVCAHAHAAHAASLQGGMHRQPPAPVPAFVRLGRCTSLFFFCFLGSLFILFFFGFFLCTLFWCASLLLFIDSARSSSSSSNNNKKVNKKTK